MSDRRRPRIIAPTFFCSSFLQLLRRCVYHFLFRGANVASSGLLTRPSGCAAQRASERAFAVRHCPSDRGGGARKPEGGPFRKVEPRPT
eukprot:3559129-Pyramimonas_sp.AAC.1